MTKSTSCLSTRVQTRACTRLTKTIGSMSRSRTANAWTQSSVTHNTRRTCSQNANKQPTSTSRKINLQVKCKLSKRAKTSTTKALCAPRMSTWMLRYSPNLTHQRISTATICSRKSSQNEESETQVHSVSTATSTVWRAT